MEISKQSLVLVVVLPQPVDLEIARTLGWYRIPLRKAPKLIQVDYLAFYQPGSFGARGGRIRFVAPVLGHELTTRRELLRDQPDHPHAREEYFKVQLGPLLKLPRPVQAAAWKRLTFLYTTGERLTEARVLNDLVLKPDDREALWKSLRERARQYTSSKQAASPFGLPDEELLRLVEELLQLPGPPAGPADS